MLIAARVQETCGCECNSWMGSFVLEWSLAWNEMHMALQHGTLCQHRQGPSLNALANHMPGRAQNSSCNMCRLTTDNRFLDHVTFHKASKCGRHSLQLEVQPAEAVLAVMSW